ncbi:hypothetical protein [Eleftheria terrae]|uniref:hypothetical protein n=1 Tax=Eleftheria terrae TaxID=1597781 RepID=UPI00263AAF59|nr:hypothetical protein [Eleftheria terrae]WKB51375.1 hypothetical protein N7L95_16375 [Eleftheria terrae]
MPLSFLRPALLSAVMAVAFLGGCATSSVPDHSPKPPLKRVAVLPVLPPGQLSTENRNLMVGWGVAWLDNRYKSSVFAEKMSEMSATSGRKLTTALMEQLSKQGFAPELAESPPAPPDDPGHVDYARLATPLPVLHVTIQDMGMYSSKLSLYYLPRINVWAGLMKPKSEDDLFSEDFYYGADARGEKYWSLPSDAKYRYATFEALMARPDEVVEGFDRGIQALAERIAEQLRQRFDPTDASPVAGAASAAR